ncbi:MAG TPA: inorganic phosphate transporter [Thermosipho africanus]|nr:inorganic phosphate transporter [Thermosipho africanus]
MYVVFAIFFGILLGSNDSANIFGPSVENGVLKYKTATKVAALCVLLGALIGGERGIRTISSFSNMSIYFAAITVFSAALTMLILSKIGIPSSSSQAIVGAILAVGILNNNVNWKILVKLVIAWVTTPVGGIIFGFLLYRILSVPFNKIRSFWVREKVLVISTLLVGAYGSYALGANNVANITGVFANQIGIRMAALVGGLSIAAGALFSNKRVMYTVSKKIIELDYFSSAISILGQSITVWIYSVIGIPVSVSQAIVGAVIGTGLARGSKLTNKKIIFQIITTWIATPLFSGLFTIIVYYFSKIFF